MPSRPPNSVKRSASGSASGPAKPITTVPTGAPLALSGPASPVTEIAYVEPVRARGFFTYRGVLYKKLWIDTQQLGLHAVGIHQKSSDKIIGAAGHRRDAFPQQTAGAALRHAQRRAPRP